MNGDEPYDTSDYEKLNVRDISLDSAGVTTVWTDQVSAEFEEADSVAQEVELAREFLHFVKLATREDNAVEALIDGYKNSIVDMTQQSKSTLNTIEDSMSSSLPRPDGVPSFSAKPLPIREAVEQELERVEKYEYTDTNAEPEWMFHFEQGSVQMGTTWKNESDFAEVVENLYNREVKLSGDSGEEWASYIKLAVYSQQTVKKHPGKRTETLNELKNRVEEIAYTDVKDAAERNAAYVEPDEGLLYVPNSLINRVCNRFDVEPRGLRVEMDARNIVLGRPRDFRANGSVVRFWKLDADWAEINEVVGDDGGDD